MRRFATCLLGLVLLLGSTAVAGARCGDNPPDVPALVAAQAALTAQCDCCAPRVTYVRCFASVVKAAVHDKKLPRRCAARVRRAASAACPLGLTATPCRTCNVDADCGTGQFCECRVGSCSRTGGVCVSRPAACLDVFEPVCGCDGTTYGNDCERQRAATCRAHAGTCTAAAGCFDTIGLRCTGEPCSPTGACPLPNEFCTPRCAATTTTTLPGASCITSTDCDDGNPCTVDRCANGHCEHDCVCVSPVEGSPCCGPGPACLRACGDTFPACDGTCPAGSSCTSLTGALACQCVPGACSPGSGEYFFTCGDPVCGGPRGHPGVPPCTTEKAGMSCACLGAECDPADDCNRLLTCATSDPTHGGMCPISRRRYKEDIQYLSPADVKRLHAEVLELRLAHYRYNLPGASTDSRLGFIIDDVVAPIPAVAPDGDTVDVYGYTSMAVAALQEQAREIDQLKHEVARLRQELRTRHR